MRYNWSGFYSELCQHGPDLLEGIDEDLRELIKEISMTTDMFWSESLEEIMVEAANAGSLRDGVLQVIDQWRYNVIEELDSNFGITLEINEVIINPNNLIIDLLIDAASQG
jgi:hypothetical protein